MAEALLTVLFENLNSMIQKEFGLLWGVNKEMRKLSSILTTICAVLEDAEERKLRDKAVKNWLQQLKDVSYELDDVLDECEIEASEMEYKRQRSTSIQKARASCISCFNPITLSRLSVAKKMKEVSDRLNEIANERTNFHLREVVHEDRSSQIRDRRQTGSIVDHQHVYGRKDDKDKIVDFLVENSSISKDLSIYPIVGMGGLGKTTLAQLVFNDERVTMHFEIKIWVCVSEDFDVKRLIKSIIESASGSACDALDMDPLQKRLQNMMERKRFFLVLDDVWNEDQEQWERLKSILSCGLNGSSIVVTTRLKKVALIMGTIPIHELSILSEDDCWLMFKQRAFTDESEEQRNLVKIGKEIIRKCGGNPLAAKTLGSLMRFKSEEKEWRFVMESELWSLPQDETSILPALRLSYFHLPIELRRCFAYCAMFPKDFKIKKQQLIHLWMANGLISPRGNMEVEDIGNEMCNELYWRSFFQDVEKDKFGNIYSFKMHELVQDLAQCIMEDECRVVEIDCPVNLSNRVRHITCNYSDQPLDLLSAFSMVENSLRSLILLKHGFYGQATDKLSSCMNFCSLRAFDAKDSMLTSISFSISNWKHLRYLNLSGTYIRILPESICLLQSLQTLDVRYCCSLEKLPEQISRLRSLRHLYIEGCSLLHHMPPNIGQLTSLRTLSFFIVDSRNGCHVDELGSLNLCGELKIKQLEKVTSPMDAKKANLACKMNLEWLRLSWGRNESAESTQENNEQVLEALEPPPTLRCLAIEDYKGRHFPNWFRNTLIFENVVELFFFRCKNCLELPVALGKLPSLRSLDISEMDLVRYVDNGEVEAGGRFLFLQSLSISDLPNLERLSREETTSSSSEILFPCLSFLYILKCPKLSLPCLQSIQKLHVTECSEVLLKSLSNLHSLTLLAISDNDDLASFPERALQNLSTSLQTLRITNFTKLQHLHSDMLVALRSLEELSITCCHMLECFPIGIFQGLNSLKTLRIGDCMELKSLSDSFGQDKSLSDSFGQDLSSLETLELWGCPELEAFPSGLNHLTSLRTLNMSGFSKDTRRFRANIVVDGNKLTALPEALKELPSLQHMEISWFKNLASLPQWLGNFTCLNSLSIYECPKLESLPTSVQNLTNLQTLRIASCPLLLERYCGVVSPRQLYHYWHMITPNMIANLDKPKEASPDIYSASSS